MKTELYDQLKGLGDKIATELVFAEPGRDLGLLPVNSLLGQIEELAGREDSAAPLARATREARRWVDTILDSTATFNSLAIRRLGEWVEWWQTSVSACQAQMPPPAIPAGWQDAEEKPLELGTSPSGKEEPRLVLNLEQDAELLNEFINESREHLQNIEQGVLVLEQHPADADTLHSIFRAFHTFKGGAGFLNLTPIQTLAHELESLLDLARQKKLAITPSLIGLILEGGDALRQFTDEMASQLAGRKPPGPILVPTFRLIERVRLALAGEPGSILTPSASAPAQPYSEAPAIAASDAVEPLATPSPAVKTPVASLLAAGPGARAAAKANLAGGVVKVDTMKLDSLVDLVGEMLIAQSLVVQNPELNCLQNEPLTRDLARLGRISKDLQRTVMALRMVPIRPTFQKMNRLVRAFP